MITKLVEARDPRRYGGKAAQLASSLGAGLPVPDGFAFDVSAVEAIVAGRSVDTGQLLASGPVAVRSSAIGEDSSSASFAGQHATALGVSSAGALVEAVREIHASARSDSARAYRKRMKIEGEPQIAVVVQRMIDPECAGVLFTRHPVTGADEHLIEGAWGLGEAVVAGLVDPDRARVAHDGTVLEHTIGEKYVAIRLRADGGTDERVVAAEDATRSCIEEHLPKICGLSGLCDRVWPGPHDIEWAIADGRAWLLQRRPITRG